ncbi:MAG TPA: hypothetical protein VLI67_08785 [Vicinamibacteria bacterium]|nr:hypothetical protein [Vicinamibacteria bacterium]
MALAILGLLLATCPVGVDVRKAGPGRIDVTVEAAPLASVLDCVGRQTGVKVTYDGLPAPRQLVSASLKGATIAEVVERLFEGQGLNYALGVDPEGRGEGLLVVSSTSASTAPAATVSSSRPLGAPAPELDDSDEGEFVADPEPAVEAPAPPAPAEPVPSTPSHPGIIRLPGSVHSPGITDPRFRPLYPEPVVLTPTTR